MTTTPHQDESCGIILDMDAAAVSKDAGTSATFGENSPAGTPAPHVGVVAVVGRTNAGKSTLVNRIVGEKVSIVSPVEQTTRSVVRGVLTEDRGQIALVDTPGLHKSRNPLGAAMNRVARAAASGADAVLLVCDASREPQMEDGGWMRRLVDSPIPVFIFLNKADAGCRETAFRAEWEAATSEKTTSGASTAVPNWFCGSAASGEGVDALLDAMFASFPPGPSLFDGDTIADHPEKLAVADAIREAFLVRAGEELPHSIGVSTDSVKRLSDGSVAVEATVYVRKESQKGMVIGAKGKALRTARGRAEASLREYFGVEKVSCSLWVKVRPGWDSDPGFLRRLGYA